MKAGRNLIYWQQPARITSSLSGVARYGHDGKFLVVDFVNGAKGKKEMSRKEFDALGAFDVADLFTTRKGGT